MPWTDDIPEPERDLDELRSVVAHRAGRLRNRRRLSIVSGAVAVVASLLVIASLPGGDAEPRHLRAADQPETSTTVDPSLDGTVDPSAIEAEPTTTVPGQTTSTTAKRKAATAPATPTTTTAPDPALAGCSKPLADEAYPKTESELRQAVTRAWLLCKAPSVFSTDEAGLELRSDGRWSKLQRRADGSLERAEGWDGNGTWETLDYSLVQVNLTIDGGGGIAALPKFSADRTKVQLNNNGVWIADYVAVPANRVIHNASPRGGDECAKGEGGLRQFSSEAEFRAAVAHIWLLCQPEWFFGSQGAGVELRADGQWWLLDRRSDGALVRGGGRPFGTWEVTDTSSMNGTGTYRYQLNLYRNGDGSDGGSVFIATASTKMRISTMAGSRDQVHAPAGTQVVDG